MKQKWLFSKKCIIVFCESFNCINIDTQSDITYSFAINTYINSFDIILAILLT